MITLDKVIGNSNLKSQIKISLTAAALRNTAIPHVLLTGPAGCGKTTCARAIAALGGFDFIEATPGSLKTPETAAELFTRFSSEGYTDDNQVIGKIKPTILFIDEAHNMPKKSQEILGVTMENLTHTYLIKIGKGRRAKTEPVTTWVPAFTVICATTDEGKLLKMFRDRFKITYNFKLYDILESKEVVKLHADSLDISVLDKAAHDIAMRSRGTPRIIVRHLERVKDFAATTEEEIITEEHCAAMFSLLGVDEEGLTSTDLKTLMLLYKMRGEAIGLDNIAISLGVSKSTILEVVEPYLILKGFIARTGRGRIITDKGESYLSAKGYVEEAEPINILPARLIKNTTDGED